MALRYEVSSFLLVFMNLSISLVNSHMLCDPKESFALLEFKKAIKEISAYPPNTCDEFVGQASYRVSTWNENVDCCSWDGVECDEQEQRHVVGLHLSCSYLYGTLHPNSTLFTLTNLQTLDLSSNYFSSSPFSPQFGMLTNLKTLDLSSSSFQGDVPIEISHLSKLTSLDLSGNVELRFSDVVMNQLVLNLTHISDFALSGVNLFNIRLASFKNFSVSLTSLTLSFCSLIGDFPDHILSLPNLHSLDLSYNNVLNGHLPMSNWSKSLEVLILRGTNFSGGIPSSIGEAKALRFVDLSFSHFNGEIAKGNNTHSNLIHLDLGSNSFIGAIPSWLYELPRLKYLALFQNHFSSFMGEFRSNSLETLDLCFNDFEGKISESIYKQVNLTNLRLCSNNFSGVLNLDMLFRIPSLTVLHLSNNPQLSILSTDVVSSSDLSSITMSAIKLEKFPYFLRHQKNLSELDLSKNLIRGKIPKWLSELSALSFLDLSHNFLSSEIMNVFLALPNLERLFLDFNLFNELPIPLLLPSTLKYLSVSNNQISGNVHPSICQATSLSFLDLSNNNFSGVVPSCLFNMANLSTLILTSNKFSGDIPMPPRISYYIASNNQFTGEIPPSICLASNLAVLSLSNNHLSGTIPPCLANMISLLALDLNSNNFSGTIPTEFTNTSKLRSIDLNNNQIEGELPRSLLNCMDLQILNLGNNKLTGYFPYWLKSASSLRALNLRSNRFYGRINDTTDPYSFTNLRIIDLSHNHFSGPLPSNLFQNLRSMKEVELAPENYYIYFEWYIFGSPSNYDDTLMVTLKGSEQKLEKIRKTFKTIDWSSNNFSGEIPKSIGMLLFLKGLNLSHNKLTGEIPTSFGDLKNLEWLDLSSNKLMGSIPSQLAALTSLSFLNLSQNQLSGRIPQGKQFATFENSSYFGNVGLCEFPLPKCDAETKHEFQAEEEEDDSLTKEFWWRVVFTGYGCGMVFGIFVGCLVLRIRKPVWIVAMVEGRRKKKKKNRRSTKRNN